VNSEVVRSEFEYWFLTPLAACVAGAAWIPRLKFGFSLRALLIATTLVAAGLRWIVHALQ
jgi:hypothetical protein